MMTENDFQEYCEARALSAELGETSTGKPQLAIKFRLLDGEPGRVMLWYGVLTENTRDRIRQSLGYMIGRDWDPKKDDIRKIKGNLEGLADSQVQLKLGVDEYNGKRSLRILFINQSGGGGSGVKEPLNDKKAKDLSAWFNSF